MKLKSLFGFVLIFFSMGLYAQDLRIHVDKKGKVGFADANGNVVIDCQYESATKFNNGTSIVMKSGKMGIIDQTGTVVLPLKYTSITPWTEFAYLVKSGKKMGLVDSKGNIVLPVNYSHISKPNCYGKAIVALGGKATPNDKKTYMSGAKYGIIDKTGKIIIQPEYKGLYEFSYDGKDKYPLYENMRLEYSYWNTTDTLKTDCSYLGFTNSGFSIYKAGILDGNGNVLMEKGDYDFIMLPKNGMVRYYIANKKETVCGYHNLNTGTDFTAATFYKNINDMTFWSHGDFVGDIAPVNGETWSVIDKSGKTLRSGYQNLKHSMETQLWAAKKADGKWDVFDENNADVQTLQGYDDFMFPRKEGDKEIFTVQRDGKYGCVNRAGEEVVPFEYESAYGNIYDVVAVKKDGKWGLLTPENKVIVPTEYLDVIFPAERDCMHFWVKKADSLYYHFNAETQTLHSEAYKAVTPFKDGIAHVAPVEMKLDDTPMIRAQIFLPNTALATINGADIEKSRSAFGYIVNTNDEVLMDLPVSTYYIDDVIKEIKKLGSKKPTKAERKDILLKVTHGNRTYKIDATISEDEWNY